MSSPDPPLNSWDTGPAQDAETLPAQPLSGMLPRLIRLCLKELREILRDRRTIVTLILMPLLLYPVLSLIFNKLLISQFYRPADNLETIVGFTSEENANEFWQLVGTGDEVLKGLGRSTSDADSINLNAVAVEDVETRVRNGEIDVAVWRIASNDSSNQMVRWMISHRPNSLLGQRAARFFERRLEAVNEGTMLQLLRSNGLPPRLPANFEVRAIEEEDKPVVSLSSFIPLMLILMTITGAVYPAIDLTAGERERGTMEALIAAPIPRIGLLLAKYVAVVFVALLTAFANLLAMTVTLYVTGLEEMVFGPGGFSLSITSQIFGLLVLFSAFFSAVLLAITSFARSFKEAQAYLIPLMLLALGPGIISLSPDIELTPSWAVTPLINIVLLARDVLSNKFDPVMGMIVIQATVIYSIAALAIAARVFGTDAVLYGSQKGWKDFLRRPSEPQAAATVSMALFCLALLFLLLFYSLGILAQFGQQSMSILALAYMSFSIVIFVGIPLFFAYRGRIRITSGFGLHRAPPLSWIGVVLLGLSLWTISHELVLVGQWLGWVSLDEVTAHVENLLTKWRQLPAFLVVLAWGVTPAIVEEFFFRGFLFRAMLTRFRPINAIVFSALVFGAFHVIGANVLTPERFLPSTFMGLALGFVAWKTGSIFPGILLHALNNSSLVLVAYFRDDLLSKGIGIEQTEHLPTTWMGAAAIAIVVGGTLILLCKGRHRPLFRHPDFAVAGRVS